jgi:hypothetical protein
LAVVSSNFTLYYSGTKPYEYRGVLDEVKCRNQIIPRSQYPKYPSILNAAHTFGSDLTMATTEIGCLGGRDPQVDEIPCRWTRSSRYSNLEIQ